jgi:hypothetical protein
LLADARLAFALLNYARYGVLKSVFGVSREQANVLTFILAMTAADAAYETTKRVIHTPLPVRRSDAAIAAVLLDEAAHAIAGPQSRNIPLFGTLLILGAAGSLAVPSLRRLSSRLLAAEERARLRRIGRYIAAGRARR